MSTETTPRPAPGQCWVCYRCDSVPTEQRGRMPELCSLPCEEGWASQYEITHEVATHVATDDGWVPLGAAPPVLPDPAPKPATEAVPAPPGTWWAGIRTGWVW